jgi:hypothetical protein
MAYMNQEIKKSLKPEIDKVLKKYGVKGTLSVDNYSTLILTLKSGIDFKKDAISDRLREVLESHGYAQVNHYWIDETWEGNSKSFLKEVYAAMMAGNWNNSRVEVDHFDVGWYVKIDIGNWKTPYYQN